MTVAAITAQVETVPALTGRVKGALDLSELLRTKSLPNVTPAAFVLPNGINGGGGSAAANAFIQPADEITSVVIVMRTGGDVTGAKTQPGLDDLVNAVIMAVIGQGPASEPGVFALQRGRLLQLQAGTAIYQLDFTLKRQLRKIS